VAAEAQAMGRPVVATDHGGARETVIEGETGWLVRPDDAASLARGLNKALDLDPASRERLAKAARAHITGKFTIERMCGLTLDIYTDLIVAGQ
jgi:glycosyltransferase involved in cell wall biosynthesis